MGIFSRLFRRGASVSGGRPPVKNTGAGVHKQAGSGGRPPHKDRKRDRHLSSRINVRLKPGLVRDFKEFCKSRDLTMTEILEPMIYELVNQKRKVKLREKLRI